MTIEAMPGSTSTDAGSVRWTSVIDIGELSPYSSSNLRAQIMIARKVKTNVYTPTCHPS